MSNLGPVSNQGLNQAPERLAYQASLYILQTYLPLYQVGKTHFFPQLRWFCNMFWTKPTNKNSYQAWEY